MTYEHVSVDKAVDWAIKDIEQGLEIVNKNLKNTPIKNSKIKETTLLSYVRFRQIFYRQNIIWGEKKCPFYRVSAL